MSMPCRRRSPGGKSCASWQTKSHGLTQPTAPKPSFGIWRFRPCGRGPNGTGRSDRRPHRRTCAPAHLIGVVSLRDEPDDNRGFWLDPAWQGQGLMTEASDAVTDYWFEALERPVLRAPKAVANVKSRRISERSGMRLIDTRDRDYVAGRLESELWEITRDEWRRRPR